MDSWTTQSGYPLVTVTRNYTSEIGTVNQTKMSEDNIPSETLWYIPINYITSDEDNAPKSIWMENVRKIDLNLTSSDNDSWVLLNIDETGKYYMIYSFTFQMVNFNFENFRILSR